MTMTWQNGRRLAGISKSGLSVTYTYNGDGIRTGKTVNGAKTSFIVDGSTIVSQQGTAGSSAYAINYLYDENGKAYGFYYNDAIYYYQFDGQGDVVSLVNHYGQLEASYSYDTWGKLLSVKDCDGRPIMDPSDVANLNIFLYRGYCYDTETGLYYLQSRYYDPNTGRFINADETVNSDKNLISYNLFIYCGNNAVNNSDPWGNRYGPISDKEIIDFMNEQAPYNYDDLYRDLCDSDNWIPDEPWLFMDKLIDHGINYESNCEVTLSCNDYGGIIVEKELSLSVNSNSGGYTTIQLPSGALVTDFWGIAKVCAKNLNGFEATVGDQKYKLHVGLDANLGYTTITIGLTYEPEDGNGSVTYDYNITAPTSYYIAAGAAVALAAGGEIWIEGSEATAVTIVEIGERIVDKLNAA